MPDTLKAKIDAEVAKQYYADEVRMYIGHLLADISNQKQADDERFVWLQIVLLQLTKTRHIARPAQLQHLKQLLFSPLGKAKDFVAAQRPDGFL